MENKLEKTENPKTTTLKEAKKEPKQEKPLKKEKVKKEKVVKEVKPKVKKHKKSSFKTKLIVLISIVSVFVTLGTFVGVVFAGNDYAMTTIFSDDIDRSYQIVSDAVKEVYEARWLELETDYKIVNAVTGEIVNNASYSMKTIHYDNNSYGYTTKGYSKTFGDVEAYYQTGNLYINLEIGKFKTAYTTAQQSIESFVIQALMGNYVLFNTPNMFIPKNQVSSLSTKLHLSTDPIYVGERFVFNYNTIFNEQEIFELDYKGNLKSKTYIKKEGNFTYTLEVKYNSINKIFTLNYPSDLNTYN